MNTSTCSSITSKSKHTAVNGGEHAAVNGGKHTAVNGGKHTAVNGGEWKGALKRLLAEIYCAVLIMAFSNASFEAASLIIILNHIFKYESGFSIVVFQNSENQYYEGGIYESNIFTLDGSLLAQPVAFDFGCCKIALRSDLVPFTLYAARRYLRLSLLLPCK